MSKQEKLACANDGIGHAEDGCYHTGALCFARVLCRGLDIRVICISRICVHTAYAFANEMGLGGGVQAV